MARARLSGCWYGVLARRSVSFCLKVQWQPGFQLPLLPHIV
ncbi:hypothetical protein HMPREF0742_01025 [Rothia aeria F0184]|uniref:Uncharacterized protein n=1 Tax=Rothia aeria F0184 TaxID=888019 RepID=U7V3T2_9MICC|nr:hypothetical protein HMPREF0742_01025 [Rothia aeria F0184]